MYLSRSSLRLCALRERALRGSFSRRFCISFFFCFPPKREAPHTSKTSFRNTLKTRRHDENGSLSRAHTQRERFKERDSKRERNSKKKRKRGAAAVCCDHHRSHRRDVPSFLLSLIRVSSFGVFFGFSKVFFLSFLHILLLKHARIDSFYISKEREETYKERERDFGFFRTTEKQRAERRREARRIRIFCAVSVCYYLSTRTR